MGRSEKGKGEQLGLSFDQTAGGASSPDNRAEHSPPDQRSLAEARATLQQDMEDGELHTCPCCDQAVKIYPRKLNANMMLFLISLYRAWKDQGRTGWVHYSACQFKGRDYPYLTLFGLAETGKAAPPREQGDEDKRMSGLWRPTPIGVGFVEGRLRAPRRVYVYNNTVMWRDTESVGVQDALGDPFKYRELMGLEGGGADDHSEKHRKDPR